MVKATDDNCKITKEVKKGLIKLKRYPRETFCDVIELLIQEHREVEELMKKKVHKKT